MTPPQLDHWLGAAQWTALRVVLSRLTGTWEERTRVGGVPMPYLVRGRGETVVLIHGFGADKETWMLMVRELPRTMRVIVPDLPGFGAAGEVAPERATARAQAAAVRGFLDRLGIARAHLVGNSMGGGIAQRVAADYPERVASLVLIGSTGPERGESEFDRALAAGDNRLVPRTVDDAEQMLAMALTTPPPLPRALQRYAARQRIAVADRLARYFKAWYEAGPADGLPDEAALARIDAPALVIHGALDRIIHPGVGEALAEYLPHARLELLDEIGHMPQVESPRRVARLTLAHIQACVESR